MSDEERLHGLIFEVVPDPEEAAAIAAALAPKVVFLDDLMQVGSYQWRGNLIFDLMDLGVDRVPMYVVTEGAAQ